MELKELKNYGKSWIQALNSLPPNVNRNVRKTSGKILQKRLGLSNLVRFGIFFFKEKRRMSTVDLSGVREKGLTDEKFIKAQVEFAALFSAMSKVVGGERALDVLHEMIEATVRQLFDSLFAGMEDFQQFDDPWHAYSEYMLATARADEQDGAHVFEIVENSDDAFQINCTYCAWYEIAKALGVEESCQANCYGDDVVFPEWLKPYGITYIRTNTLARGGACCDFRFERRGD